jgi:hypothetical protein
MAFDTGIKRVAALESDRNEIAVRVVVRALSTPINPGAAHNHLTRKRKATAGCRGKHSGLMSKWGRWLHRLVRSCAIVLEEISPT